MYVSGEYLQNNPMWHVEDSPWKAKQILKILGRNNIAPGTICEVGCGAGEILAQLQHEMPKDCEFTI
jgi:ubiquinone/menaquinone biosynthesis C-methylase UbiE